MICLCCAEVRRKEFDYFETGRTLGYGLSAFGTGYSLYVAMVAFIMVLLLIPMGITAAFYAQRNYKDGSCITHAEQRKHLGFAVDGIKKSWGWDGKYLFKHDLPKSKAPEAKKNDGKPAAGTAPPAGTAPVTAPPANRITRRRLKSAELLSDLTKDPTLDYTDNYFVKNQIFTDHADFAKTDQQSIFMYALDKKSYVQHLQNKFDRIFKSSVAFHTSKNSDEEIDLAARPKATPVVPKATPVVPKKTPFVNPPIPNPKTESAQKWHTYAFHLEKKQPLGKAIKAA